MPKVKTHSGAKKRFKRTASGKFKFQSVFRRHLLTGRRTKRKRQLRKGSYVGPAQHHQIAAMLPYGA
ncbi:MAG: 50S ribosomal protein L35 [Kofleriaceae bacterium]|nr:50S ribosomal protein L35 [Kofleriaceae bacterium]MCL4228406.1 50S ribosomal protein L35 [Myxococcales bacterium]